MHRWIIYTKPGLTGKVELLADQCSVGADGSLIFVRNASNRVAADPATVLYRAFPPGHWYGVELETFD